VTQRGDVCWAGLGEPHGSKPAKRRPLLVVQANPCNDSTLNTTLAAVITSNTGLAAVPGNVFVPAIASGLPKDSVVNITALTTLDKTDLVVRRFPMSPTGCPGPLRTMTSPVRKATRCRRWPARCGRTALAAVGLVQPHRRDLSTSNSQPGEDGSKPCSTSQRAARRLRSDHHARITSRSTSVP